MRLPVCLIGTTTRCGASWPRLGLAIVKRILDLRGSRITVSSTFNRGIRFEFDIPTRAAA